MGLHKKAINAILNLSSQERYEHTLKRITDSGVLYVLADKDGDWILWGDEKNSSLAIWPAASVNKILDESYDEALDLPYL